MRTKQPLVIGKQTQIFDAANLEFCGTQLGIQCARQLSRWFVLQSNFEAWQSRGAHCIVPRCEYLISVEFSQTQSRTAYFENVAASRELRVEVRRYTVQMCMLYDANEIVRLGFLLDHLLVVSGLSTAVSVTNYFAPDLMRPLEIFCDFCGHRTNVSSRYRQKCPEINR